MSMVHILPESVEMYKEYIETTENENISIIEDDHDEHGEDDHDDHG